MQQPPPGPQPRPVTRRYLDDAEYLADLAHMAAAGWGVTDLRRLPGNTISATYTFGAAPLPAPAPTNPLWASPNPSWGPTNSPMGPSAPATSLLTSPSPAPPAPQLAPRSFPYFPHFPYFPFAYTRRQALINRIVLGVAAGLVIVLLVVFAMSGSLSAAAHTAATATAGASQNAANASASATASSIAATQVAATFAAGVSATATANALQAGAPGVVLVSGARLGGTLSAFDLTYGAAASLGIWNTTIAGAPVQLDVTGAPAGVSLDGQDRAVVIDIFGQGSSGWSAAEDAAIVAAFLPRDAIAIKTVAGSGSQGPDHIYLSPQLANSLAASAFQSAASKQLLAPGTFDWVCQTTQPLCEVGVGTNGSNS